MSDQHLTTRGAGMRHLFLGLFFGLWPLVLATGGVLAWGQFGEVGVALFLTLMAMGLTLTGADALAVALLLLMPSTRRIGIGLAAGLVITSSVVVYLTMHGFWNGLFD